MDNPKQEFILWMKDIGLEEYTENFLSKGYFDLEVIAELDDVDIAHVGLENLPGVVKTLKLRIGQLKSRLQKQKLGLIPQQKKLKQTVLSWGSQKKTLPDEPWKMTKWWYISPRQERTAYFNDILPAMYTAAYPTLQEKFNNYILKERSSRFELKTTVDKWKDSLKFNLSDNTAAYGKFLTVPFPTKPEHMALCGKGIDIIKTITSEIELEQDKLFLFFILFYLIPRSTGKPTRRSAKQKVTQSQDKCTRQP
ncbi:uncharacterized protein [Ptychodera flava]|uniref:uncharacterized protein n=1 Tax=Ptychodera flava TaxID=63121 RepID=UPI00396A9D6D